METKTIIRIIAVVFTAVVFLLSAVVYYEKSIKNPDNFAIPTIPSVGRFQQFEMESVPISKIVGKKPTFKELW